MDTYLLTILLLGLTVFLVFSQIALFAILMRATSRQDEKDEALLTDTRGKSNHIISRALKKANQLLIAAELKGISILAREKMTGKALSEEYKEHMAAVEAAFKEQFDMSSKNAESAYTHFISTVEQTMREQIERNHKLLEEKTNAMQQESQKLLTDFTSDVEQKVKAELESHMAATKKEVEEYRMRRLRAIDEHIIDMLEEIIRIALEKKLSLADQSDLIYKALEAAKRERAFSPREDAEQALPKAQESIQ